MPLVPTSTPLSLVVASRPGKPPTSDPVDAIRRDAGYADGMRRVFQSLRMRTRSRKAQSRSLRERLRTAIASNARNRMRLGLPKQAQTRGTVLPCPVNFSFVENPEEILAYFAKAGNHLRRGRDVTIDLRDTERLSVDAIVLLLAHVGNPHYLRGRDIAGTVPLRKDLRKFLIDSGFFEHVHYGGKAPSRARSTSGRRGIISTRTDKRVATGLARDVTTYGTRLSFGAPRQYHPVYSTIIECMANTHNHAHPHSVGDTHWWLAVGKVPNSGRVAYAFVDLGVGILKGRKFQAVLDLYTKMRELFAGDTRVEAFSDILAGRVASKTGRPYRGKGLPAIFKAYQNGRIKRLVISANEIFADFDQGGPRLLRQSPFPGTFLYWEI